MTNEDFQKISSTLPKEPGIYKFLDDDGLILYVGKAKNLKSRLSSYFGDKKHIPYKARTLVKNAVSIDYTIVDSEHDALLLESTLIKKFLPRYNVLLKDGKTFSYICIKKERFPRVFFTRRVIRDGSTYFGPYTSKFRAKILLDLVKRLFQLRTCTYNLSEENINQGKFKVCLEYHIKNCKGPCEGLESEEAYNAKIEQVKNILNGNLKQVKDFIKAEMHHHATNLQFEVAHDLKEKLDTFEDYQSRSTVVNSRIKDVDVFSIVSDEKTSYVNYLKVVNGLLINTDTLEIEKKMNEEDRDLLELAIPHIREKFNSIAPEIVVPMDVSTIDEIMVTIPQRGDKKKLLELSEKNVHYFIHQKKLQALNRKKKQTAAERILKTMQEDLHMNEVPLHLECFDNSNIQGSHPVASCVVFRNAKPSTKEYRHFNIKTVEGPDDFASMEEVVYRRYRRMLDENEKLPQLIVIDGGKGQLSSAVKSLKKLDILDRLTIVGIAKKLEEIYFPDDPIPLHINKKSESLKVIQHARNEAHRFAINFHRDKRSQAFLGTQLTEIPGVGEKTAQHLLKTIGSVEKIKQLTLEQLEKEVNKKIASNIYKYFHETSLDAES
jgi:excinuclease ABC subunit C